MTYKLQTSKDFEKFIAKHRSLSKKILDSLDLLTQNPYNPSLDIKKLQGYANHYRLRIGKYRILYEIIEEQILIYAYDADSRGGVYK